MANDTIKTASPQHTGHYHLEHALGYVLIGVLLLGLMIVVLMLMAGDSI
jgi:hypothetical protein